MRSLRILIGALMFAVGGSAQAASVLLSQLPGSVGVGSVFSVAARVNEISDLYAYQFDLSYSKDLLQLDSIQEGLGFQTGGGFFAGLNDPTTGIVSFVSNALLGPGPGEDGDLDLVTFVFTAIGVGTANFDFSNLVLLDSTLGEIVPTSIAGGQTMVINGTSVPEPTSSLLVAVAGAVLLLTKPARFRAGGHRAARSQDRQGLLA